MNDRNAEPSAIAEEPHRIYSWEDVSANTCDGMRLWQRALYILQMLWVLKRRFGAHFTGSDRVEFSLKGLSPIF